MFWQLKFGKLALGEMCISFPFTGSLKEIKAIWTQ